MGNQSRKLKDIQCNDQKERKQMIEEKHYT